MGERGRLANSELLDVLWLIWTRPNFLFVPLWVWRLAKKIKRMRQAESRKVHSCGAGHMGMSSQTDASTWRLGGRPTLLTSDPFRRRRWWCRSLASFPQSQSREDYRSCKQDKALSWELVTLHISASNASFRKCDSSQRATRDVNPTYSTTARALPSPGNTGVKSFFQE